MPLRNLIVVVYFICSPLFAADLWDSSIELGYTQTSGNTDQSSIKARFDAEREFNKWLYTFHFDMRNAITDGQRTAENYFMTNRFGYLFNDYDYLYIYSSYDKDRFSGYDYQSSNSIGYGRRLLNNDRSTWDIEIGPGYRFAEYFDGTDANDFIMRFYHFYTLQLTDNTEFEQLINVEKGGELTVSRASTAFRISVSKSLSVRLGYDFYYVDKVPNFSKHADTETSVTLIYDF